MDGIRENWNTIKETIKTEYGLTEISYRTWVEPLTFHNVVNNVVRIIIPAEQSHMINYITSKYKSFFQVIITEMMDHDYDVQFILEKDIIPEPSVEAEIPEETTENANFLYSSFKVSSNISSVAICP